MWFRQEGDRLVVTLHIQPGAKRSEVAGLHGDALKIRLAAPPVDGKANAALLEFLAIAFDVPLKQVTLKQGTGSRRKVVEVMAPLRAPESLLPTDGKTR